MDSQNFKKYMDKNMFCDHVLWQYGHIKSRILMDSKELSKSFTMCELPISTVVNPMEKIYLYLKDGYSAYNDTVFVFEDLEKLKRMYVELSSLGEDHEALAILRTIQNVRKLHCIQYGLIEKTTRKAMKEKKKKQVKIKTKKSFSQIGVFFQTQKSKKRERRKMKHE